MRNGQKRMRGRNNNRRQNQNPLTRVYESNGLDVKIRGTASHIAEKYMQLARDSQGSGDPVAAENYFQHAEHYFRLIAAAQEQFRQQNPYYNQQPQQGQGAPQGAADEGYDDGEDEQPFEQQQPPQQQQPFPPREGQGFQPREGQQFQPREQQHYGNRPQQSYQQPAGNDAGGLPSFITGNQAQAYNPNQGPNGHDQGDRQDRYGHRRRRRHRGGYRPDRPDFNNPNQQGAAPTMPGDGGDDSPQPGE